MIENHQIVAVVPAAGVGSRMQADQPKQYLTIAGQTILEHSVYRLLAHKAITHVVVAISPTDEYLANTSLMTHPDVTLAIGGQQRADSVLAGLKATNARWVMVHDAARPCVRLADIDKLIEVASKAADGAILAVPARDTIKQAKAGDEIQATLDRSQIWQAMTPQMFQREQLIQALESALAQKVTVTDEASAIEFMGGKPKLVQAHSDNIKVTLPEDLALAEFFLKQYKE